MLASLSLLLALAPQGEVHGRGDRLVIPDRVAEPQRPANQDPRGPVAAPGSDEQLHKDLFDVRRSLHLPDSKELALLQKLGQDYDRLPSRLVRVLRSADADLAYGVARALEIYGGVEESREIEFLLLTRRYGSATPELVRAMARTGREDAVERLFSTLTSSNAAVRRHSAEELASRLRPEHTERLITLSRQGRDDVQLKALRLLGSVPPAPEVRARLVQALGQAPTLAESAVAALAQHGPAPAADLQEILRRPALSREFGYAALALVQIEDANPGVEMFTPDMRESLLGELEMPDLFQRSATALGLAGLAWRSDSSDLGVWQDRKIVAALIDVVSPTTFIDHLATLERPAQRRLSMLTGQAFGSSQRLWRDWWAQAAETDFVAVRREVGVDERTARTALLAWRGRDFEVTFRGPDAPEFPDSEDRLRFVLSPEDFVALVGDLQRLGFMQSGRLADGEPDGRWLSMNVAGSLARTEPLLLPAMLDRLGTRITRAAEPQLWQLYRDPEREPDATAFWRAEQRWLADHADPGEREDRLKSRICVRLANLQGRRRALAVQHLLGIENLPERITEADGLALVDAAARTREWDEATLRLLELALLSPGDEVWKRTLAVATARQTEQPESAALPRVFALAGADRVLESIGSGVHMVRRVAIEEAARLEDLRAVPPLIAVATDPGETPALRQSAVFALGRMRAVDAREPLIAMLEQPDTDAADPVLGDDLRRTAWVALGRIGGETVLQVLQKAFPSPDEDDRRAVVQALGQMKYPAAAEALAGIVVLRGDDSLGQQAQDYLRQMGELLAGPALRPQLSHPSPQVRRRVALLLAEFQDPTALPELIDAFSEDSQRLRVASLLSAITGLDLIGAEDRMATLRNWYTRSRELPQYRWFLDGLERNDVQTTLTAEMLRPESGVAAVPELTRLLVDCERPHLRALAGRMLRLTTGEDYGTVSSASTDAQRAAIAERYRFLYESGQAASGSSALGTGR